LRQSLGLYEPKILILFFRKASKAKKYKDYGADIFGTYFLMIGFSESFLCVYIKLVINIIPDIRLYKKVVGIRWGKQNLYKDDYTYKYST
jgi:hypothetical protein